MDVPGVTIEIHESHDKGDSPMGTIAICTRDHLNAATATALWTTDYSFVTPGKYVERVVVQGSILTLQRNECAKRAAGDWLLFIDDDMVWSPLDVGRLVNSWAETQKEFDEPILMGALCHRRTPPYDPTLYARAQSDSGSYRFLETWGTDLVEVDATGLAFLLIPVAAFERMSGMEWPSVEQRAMLNPPPIFKWDGGLGEDIRFCQEAKSAGCRIMVDTRIAIGHISEVAIGRRHFLQEVANRTQAEEDFIRETNEAFGIPTLTREQARRELGW